MSTIATHIRRALERVHEGRLVELRALGVPAGRGRSAVWSGYYLDYERAAADAILAEDAGAEGIYMTLQEIHPGLYARSPDQWTINPRHTTGNADVISKRWYLIDVDPRRPAGISSTDGELAAAVRIRDEIFDRLVWVVGVPRESCIPAMSGNGAHLLAPRSYDIRLDVIADLFSDDVVTVDKSVDKPSQLTKLYGTLTRKGHSTGDRPHRRSTLE